MKKIIRKRSVLIGGLLVLLYCVNAGASIVGSLNLPSYTISEPMNLLLLGFVLIGFGGIVRNRKIKS